MFKLQGKLQSMDINKNTEKYKFFPRTISNNSINGIKFISPRENSFNRTSKFPPIYFYRKVNTPYKYNISAVPKYLIKTNEEKRFMNKLYQSLNESDKSIIKDLLKKKENSNAERYKPSYVDVERLLRYKPFLYENVNNPIQKHNNSFKNQNFFEMQEKISLKNKEKEKDNIIANTHHDIETDLLNKEKNKEKNKEEVLIDDGSKNKKNDKDEISNEEQIRYKYKLSDIFNCRNEPVFTNKSAEKHLFKNKNTKNSFNNTCPNMNFNGKQVEENKKENKFYTSSESKSDWIPNKINKKKMGTSSSVAYNILCPMYKGANRFITASELNKNNLFNESPAYHRVKSISEFIDLTRVSATNTLGCFDRNMQIPNFRFKNSIGTNQLDAYHINKDLIEKPI